MGSGVLALTTHSLSGRWPFLSPVAYGLHLFNLFLFAVLAVPWLLRWLRFREAAMNTLRHPVQASFYPTFAIAMLVIAAQFLAIGGKRDAGAGLLVGRRGARLRVQLRGAVPHVPRRTCRLEHVTPAKFIPAVGLVVIPVAGGPLLELQEGAARELALLLNLLGLGAGIMMYLGLLGLTLQRKLLAKTGRRHPDADGVDSSRAARRHPGQPAQCARPAAVRGAARPFLFIALMLWGFGVWWLVMASLLTVAARRAGQMPFALSWWGFTFPLGAFVAASLRLSPLTGIVAVDTVGVACWVLLAVIWSVTLTHTLRGVVSGAIFHPHP